MVFVKEIFFFVFFTLVVATPSLSKELKRAEVFCRKNNYASVTGNIVDSAFNDEIQCSAGCMDKTMCSAILFRSYNDISKRCKHIICGNNYVNLTYWPHYNVYSILAVDLNIGIETPIGWNSGKPKLYLPLDTDTGTKMGSNIANIEFNYDGIINKAFYNPTDGSGGNISYYHLGNFLPPDYCFPAPESCPNGVSFAFWLNILSDTGNFQGIVTTARRWGPGFTMIWKDVSGSDMRFRIIRHNDHKYEQVKMSVGNFHSNYGYGKWVHYVITYKYENGSTVNNMGVYLDGVARPNSEKSSPSPYPVTDPGYHGKLDIAHQFVGEDSLVADIKMDELIIWEEQLSECDAIRLFHGYYDLFYV